MHMQRYIFNVSTVMSEAAATGDRWRVRIMMDKGHNYDLLRGWKSRDVNAE